MLNPRAGMVVHWLRLKGPNAYLSAAVNGIGAIATAVTLLIVIATKFAEGAWLVVIVLPLLFTLMLVMSWFSANWKNLIWALANRGSCCSF